MAHSRTDVAVRPPRRARRAKADTEEAAKAAAAPDTSPAAPDGQVDETQAPAQEPARGARARRRGLGDLGKQAWQKSVPELTLLPAKGTYRPADIHALCGARQADLRRIEALFPDLLGPAGKDGAARTYSRVQVEQVVRIKHLLLDEGLPADEVRRRLQAPLPLPTRPGNNGPLGPPFGPARATAQGAAVSPGAAAAAASPAEVPAGPSLSAEAVAFLRQEMEGLLALCAEGD